MLEYQYIAAHYSCVFKFDKTLFLTKNRLTVGDHIPCFDK